MKAGEGKSKVLVDQRRPGEHERKPADMKQDMKLLMATGRGVSIRGGGEGALLTLSSVFFFVWDPVQMWCLSNSSVASRAKTLLCSSLLFF